jgi:hypothetical protein
MVTTQTQPKVKRHPIRGAFWGALMGMGAGLILFNFGIITLPRFTEVSTWVPWLLVMAFFIVLGILWGMFGPAKKPKGEPPAESSSAVSAPPEPEAADPSAEPVEESAPTEGEGPGEGDEGA